MNCQWNQEKQILYAAGARSFDQRECILTTFQKIFLKNFDREKTAGLAFELDVKPSFLEVETSQYSLDRRIKTFSWFEKAGGEKTQPSVFFEISFRKNQGQL